MTIATNVAQKASVALLAIAMLFSLSFASVQAATEDELQAQITALMAQINALNAQMSGSSMSGSMCYTFTRSMNVGATGADVMELQKFLNMDAETRVSVSGPGSMGAETMFYGPATAAAVSKFQVKYRADILSPVGLVNPTGFFGPSTMAKANMVASMSCNSGSDDSSADDEDMDDEDMDDDSSDMSLRGGEASLEDFDAKDGDEDVIEEGQADASVMDVQFDVEDADIMIKRVDIIFDGTANTGGIEADPWDTFESVSLWVDGDKIAEMDADDERDYEEDFPALNKHRLRFTGLEQVFRENDMAEINVAVTVQGSVDGVSGANRAVWTVFVPVDGIRGMDGVGIDQYVGNGSNSSPTETVVFDIEEEGGDDELSVRRSTNDPDATTLKLEDDEKSDWMTVFAFKLDTEDSTNDIEVNSLQVNVAATEDGTTATSTSFLINDAQLVVDGEVFDDLTITHGTNGNFAFTFDRDEFVIDAGDTVDVEFQLEFKTLPALFEGATIEASASSSGITAEGADDLTGNQLSGSYTGDEHTLRTEGAILKAGTMTQVLKLNDDASTTDDEGVFTIKVDVTAFDTPIFINKTAGRGTTMGTLGVNYTIEDNTGAVDATGAVSQSLTSTADTEGTRFRVDEGTTETFTLTVEYDPATADFYQLQLYSLNFAATNANPTTQQLALPAEDYETDSLSI